MPRNDPEPASPTVLKVSGISKDELDQLKAAAASIPKVDHAPGLKKVKPYWHAYQTWAKARWWNREMLELVSTEFRDRSVEYYVRLFKINIVGAILIIYHLEICS